MTNYQIANIIYDKLKKLGYVVEFFAILDDVDATACGFGCYDLEIESARFIEEAVKGWIEKIEEC